MGCNRTGINTTLFTLLPKISDCKEVINADKITKGFLTFILESVAIQSGCLMLEKITKLIQKDQYFAFETILVTKSYMNFINNDNIL